LLGMNSRSVKVASVLCLSGLVSLPVLGAGVGWASEIKHRITFVTRAQGEKAPTLGGGGSANPQAFEWSDKRHVYVDAYAGRYSAAGYSLRIRKIALSPASLSPLIVSAELGVPLVAAVGGSSPFHFITIRKGSLDKAKPRGALLVLIERGFQPSSSTSSVFKKIRSLGRSVTVLSATVVRHAHDLPSVAGAFGVDNNVQSPVWYVRAQGYFHFTNGLVSGTAFFVVDDATGTVLGEGFP
jgi:hypothetical protein